MDILLFLPRSDFREYRWQLFIHTCNRLELIHVEVVSGQHAHSVGQLDSCWQAAHNTGALVHSRIALVNTGEVSFVHGLIQLDSPHNFGNESFDVEDLL